MHLYTTLQQEMGLKSATVDGFGTARGDIPELFAVYELAVKG